MQGTDKKLFFAAFISLVKTLFISTSSLSHGDKAWPIFALGGLAIWPRRISKKRTGETGTLFVAEIELKISKRVSKENSKKAGKRMLNNWLET